MRLKADLPSSVVERLQACGGQASELVLSLAADIDFAGRYATEWVLASPGTLWVISETDASRPEVSLTLAEIQGFRTLPVVGAGLLQAKVGDEWIDLVRYSNRLKYWFGRLATRLEQLRKGEDVQLDSHDDQDPRRCSTCGLMLQFDGESCPRCVHRGTALARILKIIRPYWPTALLMMLLLLAGIGIDMVAPLLTRYLVDNVLKADAVAPVHVAAKPSAERLRLLLYVVGALAGVQVLRAVFGRLDGRLATRVGTSLTYDIRKRLVEHLQRLDLSYHDKQQVGALVTRVSSDSEAIHGLMNQLTAGFLMQVLRVVFSCALMFSLAPSIAVWTLIPAPFVLLGSVFYVRFVRPRYRRLYDRSAKQAGLLSGLLSGVRVVKAFAQERREEERFGTSSAALRDARRDVDLSAASFSAGMGLLFQAGGWLVWYVGGGRVLDAQLSLGTLMAFFGYLAMFYGPLATLMGLTTWVTQFTTQVNRVFEVLDAPVGIRERAAPVAVPAIRGEVEFRNVTFGYNRQIPILKDVSFRIEPGRTVGVVGRSGSGKTTVINLVSRFYDVDEGQILIDGVDIRDARLHDLRSQMAVVLQEPFLFRGTIRDNVAYGLRDASEESVIRACKAASAHDFVLRQYHGYDTWVGERGTGLSGGERQRLSLARALLCNPKVLILDEATSSVDSEAELAIQRALEELIRGRTSIIIAHRLSTLRNCDRILVIEDGRIAEEGTHAELMERKGRYADFVKLQSGAAAEAPTGPATGPDKAVAPAPEAATPSGFPPLAGHRPRWLSPEAAVIETGERNALRVTIAGEGTYRGVYALRCMPVRHPAHWISLRHADAENHDREVGLIRDLDDWPREAQERVQDALQRRYFVHTVQRVKAIHQFQNFLNISVETHLGPLEFIMRSSQEAAHDHGEHGKMLLDLEENRYLIPDLTALPTGDRLLFERFIYW